MASPAHPPAPGLPKDPEQALAYEDFIAAVMKLRKPEESRKKPSWQIFLESPGGAALITVVLGATLGSWITNGYQSRQAEIERKKVAAEKLQEQRFAATNNALTLIWSSVAAGEDLIRLSTAPFKAAPQKQRDAVRARFNDADLKWRSLSSGEVDFKLNFYYHDSAEFAPAWAGVRDSVSRFLDCAGDWIEAHPYYADGAGQGCLKERADVQQKVQALGTSISKL